MTYKNVYITGTGAFFPGDPIDNEEIDQFIKPINSKSPKMKRMILKDNGIQTRHYGLNKDGSTKYSLAQMGAHSVTKSLEAAGITLADLGLLTAGTCGGDVIIPGFANMLQGELKAPPMETSTHIGICASGVAALRHAADSIELNRVKKASVTATEFPSRMFKHTRFVEGYDADFDSHFLRWMLSDGSGSFVLSNEPHQEKVSLKIKHIHLKSFSGDFATCMQIGSPQENLSKSIYDYDTMADAEKDGAYLLRQNIRMLPQLFEVCLHEFADLVKQGIFDPSQIDHFLTHYSSKKFEGVMEELLTKMNVMVPKERWFSNLVYRGNMGAASFFTMVDDFLNEKKDELKHGQQVLCFIPESGRFSVGYVLMEVVKPESVKTVPKLDIQEAVPPVSAIDGQSDKLRSLLLDLSGVWHDYRSQVWRTEYFAKITRNTLQKEDYLKWIENWVPQVREGSKWMRMAMSNMQDPFIELKELIEAHASEEQNDWKILFQDYRNTGGKIENPDLLQLNSNGKQLNDFMYSRASDINAVDLLGGMYIIEGTGQRIIPVMLPLVRSQLSLPSDCFKFLHYHGQNDEHHIERWLMLVEYVLAQDHDGKYAQKIISTAKQVATFYCGQMNEVLK